MIDCEYLKFNTSINTASNSAQLKTNENGDVEAKIELSLPQDIFEIRSGNKKVDKVQMQTSKMRLSMTNIPIAEFDIDQSKRINEDVITKAQIDVYPFGFDGHSITRELVPPDASAFPYYKQHDLSFRFYLKVVLDDTSILLETINCQANNFINRFPKTSRYWPIIEKLNLNGMDHMLNLVLKDTYHEVMPGTTDDVVDVCQESTIENMLQEAVENAVTYACTKDHLNVDIYFVEVAPEEDPDLFLEEYNIYVKFLRHIVEHASTPEVTLSAAFKPRLSFKDQEFVMSYDTISFTDTIPVCGDPSIIDTGDTPPQYYLTPSHVYPEKWEQPPPKKVLRYGVQLDENNAYQFTLGEKVNTAVMNIIGNESLKQSLSCLPWVKINLREVYSIDLDSLYKFKVENYSLKTISTTPTQQTLVLKNQVNHDDVAFNRNEIIGYDATAYHGSAKCYGYTFWIQDSDIVPEASVWWVKYPVDKRYNQEIETGGLLENATATAVPAPLIVSEGTSPSTTTDVGPNLIDSYRSNDATLVPGSTTTVLSTTHETITYPENPYGEALCGFCKNSNMTYTNWSLGELTTNTSERSWTNPLDNDNKWKMWLPPRFEEPFGNGIECIMETDATNQATHVLIYWDLTGMTHPFLNIARRKTQSGYVNARVVTVKKDLQTIINKKQTVIDIVNNDINEYIINLLPNLDLDDDLTFYLLDATTMHGKISDITPVNQNGSLFTVTDESTSTTVSTLLEKYYAVNDDNLDLYTEDQYYESGDIACIATHELFPDDVPADHPGLARGILLYVKDYNLDPDAAPVLPVEMTVKFVENASYLPMIRRTSINYPGGKFIGEHEEEPTTETETSTNTYPSDDPSLTPGTTTTSSTHYRSEFLGKERGSSARTMDVEFYIDRNDPYISHAGTNSVWVPGVFIPSNWLNPNSQASFYPSCPPMYSHAVHHLNSFPPYVEYWWFWILDYRPDTNMRGFVNSEWISVQPHVYPMVYKYNNQSITDEITETVVASAPVYLGNTTLSFTWTNVPVVVMSPVASIVLTMSGIDIKPELQPINIKDKSAALTTTVPIIENFYSYASSLRDLHDEIVVTKDNFSSTATYTVANGGGQERNLKIWAKYIKKDGSMHQIYIPKEGVFNIRIIFGLSYYLL